MFFFFFFFFTRVHATIQEVSFKPKPGGTETHQLQAAWQKRKGRIEEHRRGLTH